MRTLENLEKQLSFIENENNYFAQFSAVVKTCHYARENKIALWDAGIINDNENLAISERIENAYHKAIEKHKQWVINFYKNRDLSEHTAETFITSIYNDIFNL